MKCSGLVLIFIYAMTGYAWGQELNCDVRVITDQIQTSDRRIFNSMETSIKEFMNNRQWTDDEFLPGERIECSMVINLSSMQGDVFSGTMQVQIGRPVYSTGYRSPLLNVLDKDIGFEYVEFQAMDFMEGSSVSNLTSILAYYAYTILGFDYDSYKEMGGTQYYQKAKNITSAAGSLGGGAGWSPSESDRNRYWLVTELLDPRFEPLRKTMYTYHRLGLDIMSTDTDKGRATILGSLENLQKVQEARPNSYSLQVFFDAKVDEINNIFSASTPSEKFKVLNILRKVDVRHITKYEEKIR
ncbi:MAG: DUF4835 family protein [Bacteroidia bacterium]